ncbi:MAG TPA: hypothetical protein VLG13_00720 [Patescibacteria group bacterium]|nr:hypothetical protein [Patescibacteria group bacterium]
MMTKMRRFLYWAPISLLLFTLAASFVHPHTAYAAATGEFQDASTIKVGDLVFFDSELNNDFTYTLQGGDSSCAKIHRDKGSTTSGEYWAPSTTNPGNCSDQQPITFTHPERSQWAFVWQDATTITTSDVVRIYPQNPNDTTVFNETKDAIKGGGGCEDYFKIVDMTASTAEMHFRVAKITDRPDTSDYPSGILDSGKYLGNIDGCFEYKTTVAIAPYQDPSTAGALTHGATTGGAGAGSHDSNATCESSGLSINWILCAIYNGVADFSDWLLTHVVSPLLRTSPVSTDASDPTYKIWSAFRVYGDIFLVIALLVVVFGQSIGGGLIDAYTAKKVLPRLLAAAILINLSVYIVAGLVDLINIVGAGIGNLLTAPLNGAGAFNVSLGGGGTIVGTFSIVAILGTIAAGFGAIPPLSFILLFLVMPVAFGILIAFVVLVLRKAVILALILVSPIAFALYCLPNTEKYFRRWWDLLFEWLAIYPIVIALFAVADVLSVTVTKANSGNDPLAAMISFLLQFIPLLLIPFSFRLAGQSVARVHEVLSGAQKRGQELIKGNPNDRGSLRNKVRRDYSARLARGQQAAIDRGEDLTALGGMSARRRRLTAARSRWAGYFGNPDARLSTYNREMAEVEEAMSATGRDALRYAAAGYEVRAGEQAFDGSVANNDRFYNGRSEEISRNQYVRGKRLYGSNMAGIGAGLEYTTRKDQSSEMRAKMRFALAQNAKANNWNDKEVMDVWAQATFAHKDKWLSEWYSTPVAIKDANGRTAGVEFQDVDVNDNSFDKMLSEGHSVKESFRWSSLRAQDWHAMNDRMMRIQTQIDTDPSSVSQADLVRYAKISENLDAMAREQVTQRGLQIDPSSPEAEAMVGGPSPETTGVIQSMYKNRNYKAVNATGGGAASATDRDLIAKDPTSGRFSGPSVGVARNVSPDRTDITSRTRIT